MSMTKHRWRTYERIRNLIRDMPDQQSVSDLDAYLIEINDICREWRLDRDYIARVSGVPPMVVESTIFRAPQRSQQRQRSELRPQNNELIHYADIRKILNGLFVWISGAPDRSSDVTLIDEASLSFLRENRCASKFMAKSGAQSFLALEENVCQDFRVNRVEILSEISATLKNIEFAFSESQGNRVDSELIDLRMEVARLRQQVRLLTEERDRLFELLASRRSGGDIKSGFLESVGSLPVAVCTGVIGMFVGQSEALNFVESIRILYEGHVS